MFEGIEETIQQGKDLLKKKQKEPVKKPLCPICNKELEMFTQLYSAFYRCINLDCKAVGLARYLQGIKPNE